MIRYPVYACCISAFALSAPVQAGEVPLYEPAPEWVDTAELSDDDLIGDTAEILLDWQHRLEGGMVTSYRDRAIRIDNTQALDTEGTLKLTWSPDKGDLRVHRLEIMRGEEIIDLVDTGVTFEVLRREVGLEQRLLDGRLTATVAVPGLQEGDVLRLAHSITLADQALGDEMQEAQYLPAKPYRVGRGSAVISWPTGSDVVWQAGPDVELPAPVERDGYQWLTAEFPLPKRAEMPGDAPSRYSRAQLIRVGTFADWSEMSRVFSPHYQQAAMLESGSLVAEEAAGIMNVTDDPLEQMALATQLVQDEISYLLDGLDGGNYSPQKAEETWEKRYGDCKAKSVLLLALLRQMGIDADPVLVVSRGGDAMPDLLPIPANFDHMIVRANVAGTDYWLDGTSAATRLSNIDRVPAFYHALPLTEAGTDLVPMTQREPQTPDMVMRMSMDHSAGIDLPFLFKMEMELYGAMGARYESVSDASDPEMLRRIGRQFGGSQSGGGEVTKVEISYDDDAAVARILVEGVGDSEFKFVDGELELELPLVSSGMQFNPNRARPSWREVPVRTAGPRSAITEISMTLPENGRGFSLVGNTDLEGRAANIVLRRNASLAGAEIRVSESVSSGLGEILPTKLTAEKLAMRRLASEALTVATPDEFSWRWDLSPKELARKAEKLEAAYSIAVADAEDDDFGPLLSRARFYDLLYDYDKALADFATVLEEEPTTSLMIERANLLISLGRYDEALDMYVEAYDLDPQNSTAYTRADLLSRVGRHEEALEVMDSLPVAEDDRDSFADNLATVLGRAGNVEDGLAALAERLDEKAEDSSVLNSNCWYRGLHDAQLDDAVALCTRAVERAEYPASALDSRAMVHYRMGAYDLALADLDAAINLSPGSSGIQFMRGIVRLASGDERGRDDLATAERQYPSVADYYALYGITPE